MDKYYLYGTDRFFTDGSSKETFSMMTVAGAVSTTTFFTYFNSLTSHTSGIMISGSTFQSG